MIANSGWYTFTQLLHFIDLAVRDFDSHAFSCLPTYGRITMESSMARLRVLIVFLLTVCALVTSFAPAPLRKCPCGISASLQEPPGHVDDAARDFEVRWMSCASVYQSFMQNSHKVVDMECSLAISLTLIPLLRLSLCRLACGTTKQPE
jgi:hypothetical protein